MSTKNLIIYNPSFEKGGVENNIKNLIFLLKDHPYYKIKLLTTEKHINIFGKRYTSIFPRILKSFCYNRLTKYFFCSFVLFYNCIFKKNIILSFQNNIFAILIAKITFTKIIVRLNTSPDKYIHNIYSRIFFKIIYRLADYVICNSKDFVKKIYKNFSIKSNLIHNFINYDFIRKKSKIKVNFKTKKKYLKILNIGRLTDQKNQIIILKALSIIKYNFHLVILGDGDQLNNLKKFCQKEKMEKKVSFIKFTNNPYKYFKWCDLFILSSKYEGMPNVLIEAGYLKKNLISSNCPTGPKELIKNKNDGYLFKNNSVKDLIKSINDYKFNSNNKLLKSRLYNKIKNIYNNQDNLDKLIKILNKLK